MNFLNHAKNKSDKQQDQKVTDEVTTMYSSSSQVLPELTSEPPYTHSAIAQEETNRLPVPIQMGLATGSAVNINATLARSTEPQREPVVIHGSGKKSVALRPPIPQGKRVKMQITVGILLFFVVGGSLLSVLPVGANGQSAAFTIFSSSLNVSASKNNNVGAIAAVVATATAVTQDGYDPSTYKSTSSTTTTPIYTGVATVRLAGDAGNHFYPGQCTYYAANRYHEISGYWVSWFGNAGAWYAGALAAGWNTSTQPVLHSIIVLGPGVQGAGWVGHVGIVEGINANGSVSVSQWNWGAGNWGQTTYTIFYAGAGVHFVWHG